MAAPEAVYASDVLGLIEDGDGRVMGFQQAPTAQEMRENPMAGLPDDNSAGVFGPESINQDAGPVDDPHAAATAPGERLLYQRADMQGRTMGVANTSKLRVTNNGEPVAPFLMLWRLDTKQYVRVPANQVVSCLNRRHPDTGARVFALKGVDTREFKFLCPVAEDTGCPGKFVNRSDMLNHFRRRHPALWDAKATENESIRNDTQRALVDQLTSQQRIMQDAMQGMMRLMASMAQRLGVDDLPLPASLRKPNVEITPDVVADLGADLPDVPITKKPKTKLDVVPRAENVVE